MAAEIFFIYDSHCPWSYAATRLLNEINNAMPQITLNLWHNAYYDGDSSIKAAQINDIEKLANIKFSSAYRKNLTTPKDSTLAANLLAWAEAKTPQQALSLLNAMQDAHFQQGNELIDASSVEEITQSLKLSPPTKAFKSDKLTKDAEALVHEIFALQEIIATEAIPALLLAIDDELILLNHNFYLQEPKAIIEAINLELNKHK